ncbi:MAG: hypothetical protein CSB55_04180 [Candidatus Cloacimonadota bacterium]|nr:MAG: hypothetical protein CSB55_04180 [Candidatus Cloacimonadota bacterium]
MIIWFAIITVAFAIYLYYMFIFYSGLKTVNQTVSNKKPFVSVVVAARNEERNITALLTTLVNQSYSEKFYEVIIVDDDSTDNTRNIVEFFSEKFSFVKYQKVKDREKAVSPKKNALGQGIEAAKGEIILSVDADCMVKEHWIASAVASFTEDVQMSAGFSETNISDWSKSSFTQKFEFMDFVIMFGCSAGGIAQGKYFSCSGQNIAYRKSAFMKVGGFSKISHILSGDDVNLMQLFRKAGMKIRFNFSPRNYVVTKPIEGLPQFINQRSRWASNTKYQLGLNPEFFIYLASALILEFSSWSMLFFDWKIALCLLAVKALSEYNFVKKTVEKFSVPEERIKFFPSWFITRPFYYLAVAVPGQLNLFSWRGRR